MVMHPKISVIIPIYDVEKYLVNCIECVVNQSFVDFELLLIDDGSPDKCGDICDEWAAKDSRIRVFHQPNSGVSTARNNGIDKAVGEFITFVDPDDYIGAEYLSHLYDLVAKLPDQDIDMGIQGYNKCYEDGVVFETTKFMPIKVTSSHNFAILLSRKDTCDMFATCSKLYKRAFLNLNNLRFDSGICSFEDALFLLNCILRCKSIAVGNYADYYYVIHARTLSRRVMKFELEYHAFFSCYQTITSIADKQHLHYASIKPLFDLIKFPFKRALKVDYHSIGRIAGVQRREHLRILRKGALEYLKNYYFPEYKIDQIGRLLLKYNLITIYDLFFLLMFKLRIKHMFSPPGTFE